jgi:hypothetical protein
VKKLVLLFLVIGLSAVVEVADAQAACGCAGGPIMCRPRAFACWQQPPVRCWDTRGVCRSCEPTSCYTCAPAYELKSAEPSGVVQLRVEVGGLKDEVQTLKNEVLHLRKKVTDLENKVP